MHRRVASAVLLAALCGTAPARAITLPADFVSESVTPGATFQVPTGIAFTPSGRLLVCEKRGRLYAVRAGLKEGPLLDLSAEVLDNGDRGLLGIAVDPHFATNRYVYLLYTVDPDSNGVDDNDDAFGRLTRYQVSAADSAVIDPASRTVLIGASWRTGIPRGSDAHSEGALRFGSDGTLLVGCGDGAQYTGPDAGGQDPGLFGPTRTDPAEDIGAFRAQDINSLTGKVLRIDPATGLGLASNPYYDGDPASNRSRVWAYGLRNPFRFCVRPGTGSPDPAAGAPGTLYVGDVGWITYEELDIARAGGRNFGWPCYEGFGPNANYQNATPAHHGCASIGTAVNPSPVSAPVLTTHHTTASLSSPAGVIGNSVIGGAFYTADRYPSEYWGAYFHSDYGQNWVRVARFDANDALVSVAPFATSSEGAVDWLASPVSGDLYYVAIFTGEVRRLRYTGPQPNRAPIARASATPKAGARPLAVQFSSAGSSDPDGDALSFQWLFGDGTGASGASVAHTYVFAGHHTAILTADDGRGGETRDTVGIVVTASASYPTTPVLDAFARPDGSLGPGWEDPDAAFAITGGRVSGSGERGALWTPPVGADQEAFVTLATVASGMQADLLLKMAGSAPDAPGLRVRHDAGAASTRVSFREGAAGWQERAAFAGAFSAGQRLGARVLANGVVQVWRDSTLLGSADLSDVPPARASGRIGLALSGAAAARLDDFGGGDAVVDPDQPPVVTITSPADGAFFVAGDTLHLRGAASDAEEPADSLAWAWSIDLLHNNHVHPSVFTSTAREAEAFAEDHDDGTGVSYRVRLAVSDHGGHTSERTALLYPEVDLAPGPVQVTPDTVGTSGVAEYRFMLRNAGRMPAPRSRWRLAAAAVTLAEGDTSLAARDSVLIRVRAAAPLGSGLVTLRVVADTLGAVHEPDESDNARVRTLRIVNGPTRDALGPLFLSGPAASPAATRAWLAWHSDEPATAVVAYGHAGVTDSVSVPASATGHDVVLEGLALDTRYWYRVTLRDTLGNATLAPTDSFQTQPSALATDDPPAPASLALSAPWPNPASAAVAFTLELPHKAEVVFAIYDLAGREVWSERASRPAGRHTLRWDGRTISGHAGSPGLYLARVQTGGLVRARRFVLVR